jgi:hypothetical protein
VGSTPLGLLAAVEITPTFPRVSPFFKVDSNQSQPIANPGANRRGVLSNAPANTGVSKFAQRRSELLRSSRGVSVSCSQL